MRVTQLAKQREAASFLIVPMFQDQPASGLEPRSRLSGDLADAIKPVLAADESKARLEAQVALLEMRVSCRDVRRIGHDQIEPLRPERFEPVAAHKINCGPVLARVPARDGESSF